MNSRPPDITAFKRAPIAEGLRAVAPDAGTEAAPHLAYAAKPPVVRDRLLRLAEVEAVTGFKKTTIYKLMHEGDFPQKIFITRRMAAWSESSVQQWIQDRIAASGTNGLCGRPAGQ